MSGRMRLLAGLALLALAALALDGEAAAQARHPFAVGGAEPAPAAAGGLSGWILAKQAEFYAALRGAVRAARADAGAFGALAGVAFLYGAFHAAGPGHGKAVLSSYMLANERALRRGVAIAFAAAALQGLVAFAIVGLGAIALGATSAQMTRAAGLIETASYAAILALGLFLVWKKGAALRAAWRGDAAACAECGDRFALRYAPAVAPAPGASRFAATAAPAAAAPDALACGHIPAAAALAGELSWRAAATTVFAAGARPCSGAIIVLVFALAQGVFWAGAGAVAAMALGTALTTSAIAAFAVLFKGAALRLAGGESGRGALVLRGLELAAACAVALLGLGLVTGALATPPGA